MCSRRLVRVLAVLLFASCIPATTLANGAKYLDRSAPEWENVFQQGTPQARREAFDALAKADRAAVPLLVELLSSSNGSVRGVAAIGLAHQKEPPPEALHALARALGDAELNVRYWAAKAIGAYGGSGRPALPALRNAYKTCVETNRELKGPPRFVVDCRAGAIDAMVAIDPAASQQTLREALDDPARNVRDAAAAALAKLKTQ